jgi:hypothetical protein
MCQLSKNSGSLGACTGIALPSLYAVYNSQTTSTVMCKIEVLILLGSLPYLRLLSAVVAALWPLLFFLNSVPENNYVVNSVQVINVLVNLLQPNVVLFNFSG